jgi:hypothetical protein
MELVMERRRKVKESQRSLGNSSRSGSKNVRTFTEKIEVALERLSAANRRARMSGSVADRYDYLARVYRLSDQFEVHSKSKQIARLLGWKGRDVPERAWFIGRILLRTAKDDRRLRSKHAAALTYAAFREVPYKKISAFIQNKGGFNACANRLRALRLKRAL